MEISEMKKKLLFIAFAVVDFFAAIEVTSFIIASPKVVEYFNISNDSISWIINSYLYVIFAALVLFYFVSKKIKHTTNIKAFFLVGLGLFFFGSVMGGLASSIEMFYLARAIQGVGAALSFVGQLWVMTYSFKSEIGKPLFWTEVGAAAGVIAGPFLGGIFSDISAGGWRYLFAINAVVVLIAMLLVGFLYHDRPKQVVLSEKKFRKDFYFAMIVIVATIAVAVASEFVVSIFLQQFKNYSGVAAGLVLFSGSLGLVFGSAISAKIKTKKQQQIIRGLWGLLFAVFLMGLTLSWGLFFFAPFTFFIVGFFYGFLSVVLYSYISHMLPQNLLVKGVTIYLIALQFGNATGIYVEKIWTFFGYDFFMFTLMMAAGVVVALLFAVQLSNLENIEGDLYEAAPIGKTPVGVLAKLFEEIRNFCQALFYIIVLMPFKFFMNIKSHGLEKLDLKDQMIIISNHGARLDAWVILAGLGFGNFMKLHPFRIPIARKVYDAPVVNLLYKMTGMYPIESKGDLAQSLEDTFDHIDNGHSLLFFPQGHMVKKGEHLEAKKGIGHIVKFKKIHILPAQISYESYNGKNRGAMWGAKVVFGSNVHSEELRKQHAEENLHSAAMEHVFKLEKEFAGILKKKFEQVAEIIEHTEENVAHILRIEGESFEGKFLCEGDEQEFFEKILADSRNISIFLKDGNDVVGVLIARPHNDAYEELKDDDIRMKPHEEERFYIETMGVLPAYRGKFGHLKMIYKVIEEAQKRGVRNFSMHMRKENGLSYAMQRLFGKKLSHIREIESWKWVNNEPYHYVEGTFNRSLFTLKMMINSFIAVQMIQKKMKKVKRTLVG